MPRETIHTGLPDPFVLTIGWERDAQVVQVGIRTADGDSAGTPGQHHIIDEVYGDVPTRTRIGALLIDRLQADLPGFMNPVDFKSSDEQAEYLADLGRMVLDSVTGSDPFGTSIWATMTRDGINRAVRLLRRARDAAFGADA